MATIHYGSLAGFEEYCNERNITIPDRAEYAINGALVVASEWIDAVYRSSFPGIKKGGRDQQREWPREDAEDIYGYPIDPDTVPNELIYATYEAAIIQTTNPALLSRNYEPPKYVQATVTGAVSVTYSKYDNVRDVQIQFARVDEQIAPILTANTASNLTGGVFRM